jgi:hypothetical protein
MSDKVLKVIEITHLGSLFPAYTTEAQAIEAFSSASRSQAEQPGSTKTRIVVVDPSRDLLAELKALLTRAGYEVLTTLYMGEASTLTRTTKPKVLVCGPGMMAVRTAAETIESLGQGDGDLKILWLPADFHTAEAGQAGRDLLSELQSLVA